MAVDTFIIDIYRKILELLLEGDEFATATGVTVDDNNVIRMDEGVLQPSKNTVAQDGDLFEFEARIGELRDDGLGGTDDETRPTFGAEAGLECGDPEVFEIDYVLYLRHPDKRLEESYTLLEVIRRSLRGKRLRAAGLQYVQNAVIEAEYEPDAEVRGTVRPQHTITVTVTIER